MNDSRDGLWPSMPWSTRTRGLSGAVDVQEPSTIGDGTSVIASADPELQALRFRQIVFWVRIATTSVALGSVAITASDHAAIFYGFALVILGYNTWRLVRPIRAGAGRKTTILVVSDLLVHAVAAAFTGAWNSPFVVPLFTSVIIAGFLEGIWPALRFSLMTSISLGIVEVARAAKDVNVWAVNVQWTLFLTTASVMAGYARRILGEAQTSHSLAMTRVASLADANRLLTSLHTVAQVLPASLDLDEVLDSTMGRLRSLFTYDAAALLLLDDTDGSWKVARWDKYRQESFLDQTELPGVMRRILVERSVRSVSNLDRRGGGLAPKMASGVYGVLIARGDFVGMVALESTDERSYGNSESELLKGFLEPAALAIDNARVFDRLRTVGADEERTRIARDLHDRIGQSLAYVAFELDRLVRAHDEGRDLGPSLSQLRTDVRGVIGEVRDTLYDLRTDVSEEQDLATTMEEFLERVRVRSGLETKLVVEAPTRMPMLPERELWRIAQEAVINVERHARASRVLITWRADGRSALLEVADDGVGFPDGKAGRLDSYGILGMRERASSIGATLRISSRQGKGTVVQCRLDAG